jgi:hypothetical protein
VKQLLASLNQAYPDLTFTPGKAFVWSPETREVFYKTNANNTRARWSLLHETGHALLGHSSYKADIELVKMEVAAWDKAREIAKQFDIVIDEDHIQDCLDTYRDWLYRRSICPTCTSKCLQQSDMRHYRCYNCHTVWKVTPSRFARPYRSVSTAKLTPVFHSTESL